MAFHIFNLRYSLTDNNNMVIVRASSKQQAESKLRDNARYKDYLGSVERIVE